MHHRVENHRVWPVGMVPNHVPAPLPANRLNLGISFSSISFILFVSLPVTDLRFSTPSIRRLFTTPGLTCSQTLLIYCEVAMLRSCDVLEIQASTFLAR